MDDEQMQDMIDDLEDASRLLMNETGEWWSSLTGLWPRLKDFSSGPFLEAYKSEIQREHAFLKSEYRRVVSKRTVTVEEEELLHVSELGEDSNTGDEE